MALAAHPRRPQLAMIERRESEIWWLTSKRTKEFDYNPKFWSLPLIDWLIGCLVGLCKIDLEQANLFTHTCRDIYNMYLYIYICSILLCIVYRFCLIVFQCTSALFPVEESALVQFYHFDNYHPGPNTDHLRGLPHWDLIWIDQPQWTKKI